MALSIEDRGMLEKIIDQHISNIPEYVRFARNEEVKKSLMLNNDYDFVLGEIFNGILSAFSNYYYQRVTLMPSITPSELQESINEAVSVVTKRLPEVRKAIFDCG